MEKTFSELRRKRPTEAHETGSMPAGASVAGDVVHPSDDVSVIREATRQVLDVLRNEAARISSRSSKTHRTELVIVNDTVPLAVYNCLHDVKGDM